MPCFGPVVRAHEGALQLVEPCVEALDAAAALSQFEEEGPLREYAKACWKGLTLFEAPNEAEQVTTALVSPACGGCEASPVEVVTGEPGSRLQGWCAECGAREQESLAAWGTLPLRSLAEYEAQWGIKSAVLPAAALESLRIAAAQGLAVDTAEQSAQQAARLQAFESEERLSAWLQCYRHAPQEVARTLLAGQRAGQVSRHAELLGREAPWLREALEPLYRALRGSRPSHLTQDLFELVAWLDAQAGPK